MTLPFSRAGVTYRTQYTQPRYGITKARRMASRAAAVAAARRRGKGRPRVRANLRTAGFMGIERKFVDTTYTNTVSGAWAGGEADPAANTLCAPTQGDGESNRDGRRIVIKQIVLTGSVQRLRAADQADVREASVVHVALVQDTQTNGTQLSAEHVYVDANNVEYTPRNLQYSQRFRVLWSRRFVLYDTCAFTDAANTGSVVGVSRLFHKVLSVNIPVNFIGNAGSVADIADNSLHVIACGSEGAIDSLKYQCRVRFVG